MQNLIIPIDTTRIKDWESFHNAFVEIFGFPEFYGRNMDAWIDCLSSLDQPADGMTKLHITSGNVVVLHLENAKDFSARCPEQYTAIVECSSFVNYRRVTANGEPLLALSFYM